MGIVVRTGRWGKIVRKLLGIIALFLATTAAGQNPPSLPQGRWWSRPELAQRLKLTPAQQSKLDAIAKSGASELIDLRADLEKRNLELRATLDEAVPDRAEVRKAAARVSEARSRIFDRELSLLLDMRAALSSEQWTRLRATLDRPGAGHRRNMRRPR